MAKHVCTCTTAELCPLIFNSRIHHELQELCRCAHVHHKTVRPIDVQAQKPTHKKHTRHTHIHLQALALSLPTTASAELNPESPEHVVSRPARGGIATKALAKFLPTMRARAACWRDRKQPNLILKDVASTRILSTGPTPHSNSNKHKQVR